MSTPDIIVNRVSKRFGELEVLREISFEVPPRGFTCIVGPSGCGKSTLLRMILGLEIPTSGEIKIGEKVRTKGIAYIPQKSLLLPWRTALQNICLGLEAKDGSRITKASLDYLLALMGKYGLHGFENAYPNELSGGMEQRVSILRAFARNPRLLVCDEPFSSVDFVTRLKLNSEFRDLCASSETTVVFVTHNIEEALFFADDLFVLSGRPGRIVRKHNPHFTIGGHDPVEVRKDPEFNRLFGEVWTELESTHAGT
ncbi:MAG: ABC transporter ATP-binding protein [Acidobacteria bacterium]|nr:ABC transporter ATP-binding protein [Acidobacteriota bacterium]